jgi:hypothetical protein
MGDRGGEVMIEQTIERWHEVISGDAAGLDDLLADDVVFYSPVVFTPQKGKAVTKLYLGAAGNTLGGGETSGSGGGGGKFRYSKEILAGNQAMLEFETEMDGKYVNGVDIITCNDEGRIVEFKVMIRPLQAIQTVHAQMARMLEAMKKSE